MTNFKHINADEQLANGTITSPLFAPGAVNVLAMNINADLSFNEFQALEFRLENVSVTPTAGNVGRLVYNTVSQQVLVDNGTAFVSTAAVAGVSSINTLTGAIVLAAGSNVTISPSGNTLTISSTGSGGSSLFAKDLFTIVTPSLKQYDLSQTPIANSEIVSWNGQVLAPGVGNDYIIVTSPTVQVQFSGSITFHVGDSITVTYAY